MKYTEETIWVDVFLEEDSGNFHFGTVHSEDPGLLHKAGAADSYIDTYPIKVKYYGTRNRK